MSDVEEGKEDERFISIMVDFPDYVQAVGMISIELADLEASLADLLAAMLDIETDMAHALYFSPKVVIPRLEILRNVDRVLHSTRELDEKEVKSIREKLKGLCKEAEAAMGKRNRLLHAAWGVVDGVVHFGTFPLKEGKMVPITLEEVEDVVDEIRALNDDVYELVDLIGTYRTNDGTKAAPVSTQR